MKLRFVRAALTTANVGLVCLALASWANAQGAKATSGTPTADTSVPTPRTPDGKPDLNGMWGATPGLGGGNSNAAVDSQGNITANLGSRRCGPTQVKCSLGTNEGVDGEFTGRMDPNRPLYRPEFWDKVQYLDLNTNTLDPVMKCQPTGVPRMGPPKMIVQQANRVIFFYSGGGVGTQPEDFRIIPTDGRPHNPERAQDVSYYGDAAGHWEGDTLVVDLLGFNDETWLRNGGYFHSENMHVIEKLRREGNILHYQVTVDDPDVLLQPWVMNTQNIKLNPDPNATIAEGDACRDYDSAVIDSKIRH